MLGYGLAAIGASIALGFPAIFAAIGQGIASGDSFLAIAKKPSQAGTIRTMLLISLAIMETLAIYGLLISFMIIGKFA